MTGGRAVVAAAPAAEDVAHLVDRDLARRASSSHETSRSRARLSSSLTVEPVHAAARRRADRRHRLEAAPQARAVDSQFVQTHRRSSVAARLGAGCGKGTTAGPRQLLDSTCSRAPDPALLKIASQISAAR